MALDTHNALGYIWNFKSDFSQNLTWHWTTQLRLNWQKQTQWNKKINKKQQPPKPQENSPPPPPQKKKKSGGGSNNNRRRTRNSVTDWNTNKTNWKSRHCKPAKVAFDSTEPRDWHAARMTIAQPTPPLKLHHLRHIDVRFNKMLLSLRQSLSRHCGTGTAGTD